MEIITFLGIGICSRLIPHLPNMTAVGATALFMGSTYGVKKSLVVVLATMLIADTVLGLHAVMWATYGSFFIAILIGKYIASKRRPGWIIGGTLLSSIIFFLVTNFAVWIAPNFMYPKNLSGLMECYMMAIPFFKNSLLGDLMYSGIFFGGFELVRSLKQKYAMRQINK